MDCSSPRAPAARGRGWSTPRASGSWRSTRPTSWSSPLATSCPAPSRPRSTRAAASRTARWRSTSPRCRAGVDITREPIHIHPGQHYIMGGVKTDVDGQTTIPGLYAAGEVACVSVHGGNRLGANSLLDTLIFGRRSGEHAGRLAKDMTMPSTPAARVADTEKMIRGLMNRQGGRRVSALKEELGESMNKYAAVFRDEAGLQTCHEIVRRLKEEAEHATIDDRGTVFNQ